MKKVIALHASKRKLNTYGLLLQIRQLLSQEDVEVEIVPLYDLSIEDCLGCEKCIRQGECVWHDGMENIMAKLEEADGVILSSPVYLQQISGKLKTLIDRTCMWFHRPALYGKPVLCVATTKGSGLRGTLAYLHSVAVQWGAMPVGQIGRTIRTLRNPITVRELAAFTACVKMPSRYRPPMGELMNFEVQKALGKHLGGLDAAYWVQKGWNTKPYYISCRVGRFRPLISGAFGAFLQRRMAKSAIEASTNPQG